MIVKTIINFFLDKVYYAVIGGISNWIRNRKIKKKVKEISKEKDPQTRAKRLNDLLNS